VSLQRRKLSKSFATPWYLAGIGPDEIGEEKCQQPKQKGRSLNSGMQTEMSVTVGLARKGLLTYRANIFTFKLEEVQYGSQPENQKLTAFMIVLIQCASPVRDAVRDK
jgi:hypothetical protein